METATKVPDTVPTVFFADLIASSTHNQSVRPFVEQTNHLGLELAAALNFHPAKKHVFTVNFPKW